jgi:hypothetical protein
VHCSYFSYKRTLFCFTSSQHFGRNFCGNRKFQIELLHHLGWFLVENIKKDGGRENVSLLSNNMGQRWVGFFVLCAQLVLIILSVHSVFFFLGGLESSRWFLYYTG